jgi:type II secretory pathway pseudopilin PulG
MKVKLNEPDAGFTLMEMVVTISIIMVISGSVMLAFTTGFKTLAKTARVTKTAFIVVAVDQFIREETEGLHIPYFTASAVPLNTLKDSLWRSRHGNFMTAIDTIKDRHGRERGIRVHFAIDGSEYVSEALIPSIPVTGVP